MLEQQRAIIAGVEALEGSSDGARFVQERWARDPADPNAGYGITAVLEGGRAVEKGAVNVSVVAGTLSRERAAAMSSRGRADVDPAGGQPYAAVALSLVLHSAHPLLPTLRADVRVFEVAGQRWYGGGADLTPFYLDEADAAAFHAYWRALCDRHDPQVGA